MIKVSNWMTVNQLTINTNWSFFIIIQPRYHDKPIQINIDGQYKNPQGNVKYLGIQLDQHLNFKYDINLTEKKKKLARASGILWIVRKCFLEKIMLNLNQALFQPHLLYGLSVWGSTFPYGTQKRLQLIQNNAIRSITGRRKYDHYFFVLLRPGRSKNPDLCKVKIAILMYKLQKSNLSSPSITNLLNHSKVIDIPLEAINN